jgi:hypothetical protein
MVDAASGVEPVVLIVAVVVQVGLQDVGLKEADAPVGNPEAVKVTGVVFPEDKVAVILLPILDPWATVFGPPLERVKPKGRAWVVPTTATVWAELFPARSKAETI